MLTRINKWKVWEVLLGLILRLLGREFFEMLLQLSFFQFSDLRFEILGFDDLFLLPFSIVSFTINKVWHFSFGF